MKFHIDFYQLITVLRVAFGGNSYTHVIVNTRCEEEHADETLQSLRFGERCAMISNDLKRVASSYKDTLAAMETVALETVAGPGEEKQYALGLIQDLKSIAC